MADDKGIKETETPTQTEESDDTHEPIEINGDSFSILNTKTKKGKNPGRLAFYLEPNKDEPTEKFLSRFRVAVGPANYDKAIMAYVIRPCSNDSTLQAIDKAEDGRPTDVGLSQSIIEWFLSETRRGPHIKDLREKSAEIFAVLNPLLTRHFKFKPGQEGALNESEYNQLLQLSMEFGDLQSKIEEKTRKGKKGGAKKEASTASK